MTTHTLITSTFPGIASNSPEMLAPLLMIVGAFSLAGIFGISVVIRDWIMRRS